MSYTISTSAAEEIRDEVAAGANTATRVGNALLDIINDSQNVFNGITNFVFPDVIFVASNGNDSTGDGSQEFPYLTAQKGFEIAISQSQNTNRIFSVFFSPGIYTDAQVNVSGVSKIGVLGSNLFTTEIGELTFTLNANETSFTLFSNKNVKISTVSLTPPAQAANGANGQNGQDGPEATSGGHAGVGTGGTAGKDLVIFNSCVDLIELFGGQGGNGGNGGNGGSSTEDINPSGNGGHGGNAGPGGPGGNLLAYNCILGNADLGPGPSGVEGLGGIGGVGGLSNGTNGNNGLPADVTSVGNATLQFCVIKEEPQGFVTESSSSIEFGLIDYVG